MQWDMFRRLFHLSLHIVVAFLGKSLWSVIWCFNIMKILIPLLIVVDGWGHMQLFFFISCRLWLFLFFLFFIISFFIYLQKYFIVLPLWRVCIFSSSSSSSSLQPVIKGSLRSGMVMEKQGMVVLP